ncbi:hypothetical protein M899_1461 [Bacteriovorax sp. BSW11_IV]|uniref:hypothetical protein n=1 Tax=Bacteriovorax sp. BSW11_IV TaxID=1353529 RepID=UPI000389DC5F|nr:hypothetical protein [Bacteriovorax sp. BSW11_IV]EQC48372.1 hypothetical protein M899_1461 [Bacteriovorax sp. BSW11_IV]
MSEQKKILDQFMSLYNRPTYEEMSSVTGIQVTRCFRLVNGAEMKLKEYLIFKKLISDKVASESLITLAESCLVSLNETALKEIADLCERKLFFKHLSTESHLIEKQA